MAYTGSKAKAGRGSVLTIGGVTGAVGTEVFVTVGEVDDASFTGGAWSTAETTNFQSGADEEFITTTRNNGEVNIEGNLVDGDPGQAVLTTAYGNGQKYDFKVVLPLGPGQTTTGTMYTFSALVMSFFEIKISTKGIVTFSGKLKISGQITTIAGS